MRHAVALQRVDDHLGLRRRDVGAERLHLAGREVDGHDPRRQRRRRGREQRARAVGREVDHRHEVELERAQLGGPLEHREVVAPAAGVGAHDAPVVQERVPRLPEDPQRPADLRLDRRERLHAGVRAAVQVPPADAVRAEVQHAVGAPLGLHDGLGRTAGDQPRAVEVIEVGDPQLRALPRHPGVVPRQPRDPPPVGRDAGRGEEVVPADQDPRLARAVGRDRDEVVDVLGLGEALADAQGQAAVGRHAAVGVADAERPVRLGRQRARLAVVLAVDALVGAVGEEHRAAVDRERAAAVLVHARAHVEAGRGHVGRRRPRRPGDDHAAAVLVRVDLRPVDDAAGDRHQVIAPAVVAGDRGAVDRRLPGTVWSFDGGNAEQGKGSAPGP